jgi:hypothetical protein
LLCKGRSEVAGLDLYRRIVHERTQPAWICPIQPADECIDAVVVINVKKSKF